MGMLVYEGGAPLPHMESPSHPVNARRAVYTLPTCPDEIKHLDQAVYFHGTTWKSWVSMMIKGGQILPSSGRGGETFITESCVDEDAIFVTKKLQHAMRYASPFRLHDPNATHLGQNPLIQDFRRWKEYLRDRQIVQIPYVRIVIRCVTLSNERQPKLDSINQHKALSAASGAGEEAYKPANLIPCFVEFISGANMQRDASYSELRLRDRTCMVRPKRNGVPMDVRSRINAAHLQQDMLPKTHQLLADWPHMGKEMWPQNLCAPGEEHHGSSLDAYIAEGEANGTFAKLLRKGDTVFAAPPTNRSVLHPAASSIAAAAPMPRIERPTADADSVMLA